MVFDTLTAKTHTLALALLLCVSTPATQACSDLIKENRLLCPGNLFVQLTKTSSNPVARSRGVTVLAQNGESGQAFSMKGSFEKYPEGMLIEIEPGLIDIYAFAGSEGMDIRDDSLIVRPYSQADSLFTYHRLFDFSTGFGSDFVKLEKQYTLLSFKLPSVVTMQTVYVEGEWGAFDSVTMKPLRCRFSSVAENTSDGNYACRVLRQGDDNLSIVIREGQKEVSRISLQPILSRTRYDWGKRNLDDIIMIFDTKGRFVSSSIVGYIDNDQMYNGYPQNEVGK